jgi:hypothetical protein
MGRARFDFGRKETRLVRGNPPSSKHCTQNHLTPSIVIPSLTRDIPQHGTALAILCLRHKIPDQVRDDNKDGLVVTMSKATFRYKATPIPTHPLPTKSARACPQSQ